MRPLLAHGHFCVPILMAIMINKRWRVLCGPHTFESSLIPRGDPLRSTSQAACKLRARFVLLKRVQVEMQSTYIAAHVSQQSFRRCENKCGRHFVCPIWAIDATIETRSWVQTCTIPCHRVTTKAHTTNFCKGFGVHLRFPPLCLFGDLVPVILPTQREVGDAIRAGSGW